MPVTRSRSSLHVEGTDDNHAIRHLLIRHGIDYDQKRWPMEFPEIITDKDGKPGLLGGVKIAVELGTHRATGFVLDADSSVQNCWDAVSSQLRLAGVETPDVICTEGFIGESQRYRARAGVWIMPDNQREGTLENFLLDLIEEGDTLYPHASESVEHAKKLGAGFSEDDTKKAELHTWLAWQKEPGLPYGTAMRARFFRDDSQAAREFVAWFRKLFKIPRS